MNIRKPKPCRQGPSSRGEVALVFSVGQHRLAIAASVLQEIRHDQQQDASPSQTMPIVSAGAALETPLAHGQGLLILRESRVAVRVDNMECMIETQALHPLPNAFQGQERRWYDGLALVREDVIPRVNPAAFFCETGSTLPSSGCSKELQLAAWPEEISKGAAVSCQTLVVFPLGDKRFALSIDAVSEICRPARVQTFPHTTPGLLGVVVHRGRILPVWNIASLLLSPEEARPRKFYLIAHGMASQGEEWIAIPVSGECQRVQADIAPSANDAPSYVRGLLQLGTEEVECLDLTMLARNHRAEISPSPAAALPEMHA